MIQTNKMPKEHWNAGDTLCKQGDPGNTLFIITEGSISVETSTDGVHEKITELEPGSIIGEMSLIDNSLRYFRTHISRNNLQTSRVVQSFPPCTHFKNKREQ
jgi:CRP-like cAMP-binding protein